MLKSQTMRRMGRPLGRLSPRPLLWRAGVGRTLAETLLLASCLLTLAWAHSVAVPAIGRDWT
ncbi:MAG TPA: hypothetical protein VGE07_16795, partial [Herpetosiphonaceae bacterium]